MKIVLSFIVFMFQFEIMGKLFWGGIFYCTMQRCFDLGITKQVEIEEIVSCTIE